MKMIKNNFYKTNGFFYIILSVTRKIDTAAMSLFEHLSACSKSFAVAGLVSGIAVATCAAALAVYISIVGYSMELNDILNMFIDRSAALPAISLLFCLISEICRVR